MDQVVVREVRASSPTSGSLLGELTTQVQKPFKGFPLYGFCKYHCSDIGRIHKGTQKVFKSPQGVAFPLLTHLTK